MGHLVLEFAPPDLSLERTSPAQLPDDPWGSAAGSPVNSFDRHLLFVKRANGANSLFGENKMAQPTRHIKLFAAGFFSTLLLVACAGEKASNDSKHDNAVSSTNSTSSDSSIDTTASFSATLDGVKIAGNGVDELQQANAAFIYPQANDKSKRLLFFLRSTKDGSDTKPDFSFRFSIPDKEGAFTKNIRDGQPYDITLDFLTGDLSRYWAQAVTVNLTSVTASRVEGTFAGKFTLSDDTPRGSKKEVTVSDGKFDIPYSASKIKPE